MGAPRPVDQSPSSKQVLAHSHADNSQIASLPAYCSISGSRMGLIASVCQLVQSPQLICWFSLFHCGKLEKAPHSKLSSARKISTWKAFTLPSYRATGRTRPRPRLPSFIGAKGDILRVAVHACFFPSALVPRCRSPGLALIEATDLSHFFFLLNARMFETAGNVAQQIVDQLVHAAQQAHLQYPATGSARGALAAHRSCSH